MEELTYPAVHHVTLPHELQEGGMVRQLDSPKLGLGSQHLQFLLENPAAAGDLLRVHILGHYEALSLVLYLHAPHVVVLQVGLEHLVLLEQTLQVFASASENGNQSLTACDGHYHLRYNKDNTKTKTLTIVYANVSEPMWHSDIISKLGLHLQ